MNESLNFYQKVEDYTLYKKELLIIAKMNYPEGTVFRNSRDNDNYTVKEGQHKWYSEYSIDVDNTPGLLFTDKRWAEIIASSKNEFHQGDYIVTLDGEFDMTSCAKKNYCFKQRCISQTIQPEKDIDGSEKNGNGSLTFNCQENLKSWRYATKEEIRHYNEINRPFDVTALKADYSYNPCNEIKLETPTNDNIINVNNSKQSSIIVPKIVVPKKQIKPIIIQNFILHI